MQNRRGFTLTEVLAVVVIIGILMSVALPQYRRAIKRARATEAIHMMRVIYDSAQRFAAEMGYRDMTYVPSNMLQFSRLDMFDSSTLKCSFDGNTMTCDKFTYSVSPDVIVATDNDNALASLVLYVPNGGQNNTGVVRIVCRSFNDEGACDPYGLEWENSWSGRPAPEFGFEEEEEEEE